MSWLDGLRYRLRTVFRRSRTEASDRDEQQFHLNLEEMHQRDAGLDMEQARLAAKRRYGNVAGYRIEVRESRASAFLERIARDFRYGLRSLHRAPGFVAASVLTLGLGIGAVAGIGSLAYGVLLRSLPYPNAERLVELKHIAVGLGGSPGGVSDGFEHHYRKHSRTLVEVGLYEENDGVALTDQDDPIRLRVALVSPSILRMLQVTPALGTIFDDAERHADVAGWVMISYALWRGRYGGDSLIVGKRLELNRNRYQVVGVMPQGFDFPHPHTQVWYKRGNNPATARVGYWGASGIGLLAPGVNPTEAATELTGLIPAAEGQYRDATAAYLAKARPRALVTGLRSAWVADVREPIRLLTATGLFVLLIGWANVTSLVLVRAERHRHQIGVERALGAGTADIARRVLSETMTLAMAGGLVGLGLAYAGLSTRFGFPAGQIPRWHEIRFDGVVVLIVAVVALLTGLVLGAAVMLRLRHRAGESSLPSSGQRVAGRRKWRDTQQLLVAGQVALAVALLVASAVMVKSLQRLRSVDLGFDPRNVVTMSLDLPARPYPGYLHGARFYDRMLAGVRHIPGVESADAVGIPPLAPNMDWNTEAPIEREGGTPTADQPGVRYKVNMVTPGYFATLRIPIRNGRPFQSGDLGDGTPRVIASAALAAALFGSENPIGKRVRAVGDTIWHPIVGVVGNVPGSSVSAGPERTLYFPAIDDPGRPADATINSPWSPSYMTVVIRTSAPPGFLLGALRQAVQDADSKVPVAAVGTLITAVDASMARLRLTMLLLLVAAGTALCLGAIGVYGVISYGVTQQFRELGIRLALGASPKKVTRAVLRRALAMAVAGVAAGVVIALGLTRLLRGLLFEVSPNDPAAILIVTGLILSTAAMAGYLPARRAGKIDPASILRAE